MPKIKTCRAAAKRFKKTGTGKIMRNKAYKSQHCLIFNNKQQMILEDEQEEIRNGKN